MMVSLGISLLVLLLGVGNVQGHNVCYPVYGCFSDNSPFHRAAAPLPASPRDINTSFFLYTRTTSSAGEVIDDLKNETIATSDFKAARNTIIITHGYLERVTQFWFPSFVKALLAHEDANVIIVGWGNGAGFPYHACSSNARVVGAQVFHLLEVIHSIKGLDHSRVHLIGFSVGAHVMGYVGRNYRRKGIQIGRITGLDPAAPLFEYQHPDVSLDPTDASFVDAIHTNSKLNGIFSMGYEEPLGHLDFYPNGGKFQPGCPDVSPGASIDLANIVACSHYRSVFLYIASLNRTNRFQGYPCDSWEDFKVGLCMKCRDSSCPQMGHFAEKPTINATMHKFFLETSGAAPYSGEHYQVTFYTGTGFFSDLDAEVDIELVGKNAHSRLIRLEKRHLPAGSTGTFIVTTLDLGDLSYMTIKTNAWIRFWYLDKVEVAKMPVTDTYGACYKSYVQSFSNKVLLYKNNHSC